ncbi:hypothetical protein QVD17_22638 [Tagetes erecta]|uniref:AP2/ERF domain-containing protein n=1 Tax=Tagetes erecta TaxID=13708 RepID=A0AAD8NLT6_TARER|nr:hypothetical protein QVD17_22638 [Tagetes erecta]
MLDLNLNYLHQLTIKGQMEMEMEMEESATSNSSLVNTEACSSSNVADDDSVSVDNFHCFNFDILKPGDAVVNRVMAINSNDEDPTCQFLHNRSEFVTRTLFPMRHEEGRLNQEQQVSSLLLFNNNSESVHVQHVKQTVQQNQLGKKSRRGPRSRSSQYRGVTFYRRTGRWESHIWDCGKQVYLGGFDTAHAAARAYDRAAIKFRGVEADINFNISDYDDDMNQIKNLSKEDFVHMLRRHNSGFSRGGSKYRGPVIMNNCGISEPRMGQFLGNKAYDNAAIKPKERVVVSNFEPKTYEGETVASHYGNNHNLDLNLHISTPSCHGNSSSVNANLNLQAGNPCTLPIISEHGQPWTGIYPQTQTIGGHSNWAWQPHGRSQTPTALFTAAASSGFPAPTTSNSLNYN